MRATEGEITRAADGSALKDRAIERRARVIEAAVELGTQGGYDAVHMRVVAERAGVALATVYRYFESKDHLLSATASEWSSQLRAGLARSPARGDTAADRLVDVLRRATRALERRPLYVRALVRALASPDPRVAEAAAAVRHQIGDITLPLLESLPESEAEAVVSILAHVWGSTVMQWASDRAPVSFIGDELELAARTLVAGR